MVKIILTWVKDQELSFNILYHHLANLEDSIILILQLHHHHMLWTKASIKVIEILGDSGKAQAHANGLMVLLMKGCG
jgi:hypothetical protein